MCLKYFVGHSTCDHHEYLGSHHCSTTPCDLDAQHFHYIQDNFSVVFSPSLQLNSQTERSALACTTCATKHRDRVDPDGAHVQSYPPTNNFDVKEINPTGYSLPIRVVRAETEDVKTETVESEDSGDNCDYDYKSLSDADEEEWHMVEDKDETMEVQMPHNDTMAQMHRDFIQGQLKDLPNYLAQQRPLLPFVPSGLAPEAYAMGNYPHYPMPHTAHLAAPTTLPIPQWHGGMPSLFSVPTVAVPARPDDHSVQPMESPVQKDAATPATPAVLLQLPATPPPTPPTRSLAPHPTPPFIVGSITDAYLRMEAAKRGRMRERARRAESSLRDVLPARSMALTDFVVNKKSRRGHRKDIDAAEDTGMDTWSSLPLAGEASDTEGGAEESAGIVGSEKATCGFSCRLVTLM